MWKQAFVDNRTTYGMKSVYASRYCNISVRYDYSSESSDLRVSYEPHVPRVLCGYDDNKRGFEQY